MKYIGIDYGTKRIGIALSDKGGNIAFANSIVPNDSKALDKIAEIIKKEQVEAIVVGESKDFSGGLNEIFSEVKNFSDELNKRTNFPIFFEPEFLTSHAAEKQRFEKETSVFTRADGRKGRRPQKKEPIDAVAAALILQSYLDKKK